MLTNSELKHLSAKAKSGDKQALCYLALHEIVEGERQEGLSRLQKEASTSVDSALYMAVHHLSNEEPLKALPLLAMAIDAGDPDAPYFLWTIKPESTHYLKLAHERGSLLATRALSRQAPNMNGIVEHFQYHQKALEYGDLDSFYFLCLDGPTYYEPEMEYVKQRSYTPYLYTLLEEERDDELWDTMH